MRVNNLTDEIYDLTYNRQVNDRIVSGLEAGVSECLEVSRLQRIFCSGERAEKGNRPRN